MIADGTEKQAVSGTGLINFTLLLFLFPSSAAPTDHQMNAKNLK